LPLWLCPVLIDVNRAMQRPFKRWMLQSYVRIHTNSIYGWFHSAASARHAKQLELLK